MSKVILIQGASGSGKSFAGKHLDNKTNFWVNIANSKDLPFPGSRKKYKQGSNLYSPSGHISARWMKVIKYLDAINNVNQIKTGVLDDFQFLMGEEFLDRILEGGWEKFNDVADHAKKVWNKAASLRDDITVFVLAHTEQVKGADGEMITQMKTVGQAFRKYATPEGWTDICLLSDPVWTGDKTIYRFRTFTKGKDPFKSPEGMFPPYMPNNLELVHKRVNEYYDDGVESWEDSPLFKDVNIDEYQKESLDIDIEI